MSAGIDTTLSEQNGEPEVTEIESYCFNCSKHGITKLLLTKIPYYKDVILSSFQCDHCGWLNNEIQSAGKMEEKGVKVTVNVVCEKDLSRQVIKSDWSTVKIPEIDLEIPSGSQKGEITTVEGILERVKTGLLQDQSQRKENDPEDAEKIEKYIDKIKNLLIPPIRFTLIIDDISGNSYVSNPHYPLKDSHMSIVNYVRTTDQDHALGIYPAHMETSSTNEISETADNIKEEVLNFHTNCPNCNSPCETHMKVTDIPHFKEVVIMATICDACGVKSNEVKSGGGISSTGQKITLNIVNELDLSRDILKSETCNVCIPELDFEAGCGMVGGKFTTIEGLIESIKDEIKNNNIIVGDSSTEQDKGNLKSFLDKLDDILNGKLKTTIVLDDSAGNSYVQSLYAPDPDPQLTIENYTRTYDQNEYLGLNDMKTEGYEND